MFLTAAPISMVPASFKILLGTEEMDPFAAGRRGYRQLALLPLVRMVRVKRRSPLPKLHSLSQALSIIGPASQQAHAREIDAYRLGSLLTLGRFSCENLHLTHVLPIFD
jgi:hypothetical protein